MTFQFLVSVDIDLSECDLTEGDLADDIQDSLESHEEVLGVMVTPVHPPKD